MSEFNSSLVKLLGYGCIAGAAISYVVSMDALTPLLFGWFFIWAADKHGH